MLSTIRVISIVIVTDLVLVAILVMINNSGYGNNMYQTRIIEHLLLSLSTDPEPQSTKPQTSKIHPASARSHSARIAHARRATFQRRVKGLGFRVQVQVVLKGSWDT